MKYVDIRAGYLAEEDLDRTLAELVEIVKGRSELLESSLTPLNKDVAAVQIAHIRSLLDKVVERLEGL